MKTKKEIINETAAYYDADVSRRGLETNGTCTYYNPTTKTMCAVGRCAIDASVIQEEAENPNTVGIFTTDGRLNSFLKPEYQGHDCNFWIKLQAFHDAESYWNENGLTPKGEERKAVLLKMYEETDAATSK